MSGRFSRTRLAFLALVFGVLIVNAVVLYLNIAWLARNEASLERTHYLLLVLERLTSTIKDAETGQRGFMITGDESYLRPFETANRDLPRILADFTEQSRGTVKQGPNVKDLAPLVDSKMNELRETVALMQKGDFEGAKARLETNRGKRYMDEIREAVGKIEAEEKAALENQRNQASQSFKAAQTATFVGLTAGLATVAIAFYVLQKDRTEELSLANDALLKEVEERRIAESKANALALELGRSNRELQEFASVASHDLQEPLRKIQAFGDRLRVKLVLS